MPDFQVHRPLWIFGCLAALCSVNVSRAATTPAEDAGGPLGIWREWARKVTGRAIRGGHFFPEQNADTTIAELRSFFGEAGFERPHSITGSQS